MKLHTQKKLRAAIGYGVGGTFCFLLVLPLIWVASTSLRPIKEMMQVPPVVLPQSITFDAYVKLWEAAPFVKYFFNSVFLLFNLMDDCAHKLH